MGRKDAVPPQSDADSHSVRPHEGERMKWGKKESKKRQCERKRDKERKYVSAGKTKTVHKGNTRQTHIAHTGENTNVCNQTE